MLKVIDGEDLNSKLVKVCYSDVSSIQMFLLFRCFFYSDVDYSIQISTVHSSTIYISWAEIHPSKCLLEDKTVIVELGESHSHVLRQFLSVQIFTKPIFSKQAIARF